MGQWPSAELKPPGPRMARFSFVMWWLLFAVTVVAIIGGVWRGVEQVTRPTGWDRVGLVVESNDQCFKVTPKSHQAKAAWPDGIDEIYGGCIVAVAKTPVTKATPADEVASLLDGPVGTSVDVGFVTDEGAPAQAAFLRVERGTLYDVALIILDTLVATLYAVVALLLWRRRNADPVSRRISFAFLLLAHIMNGPAAFWLSIHTPLNAIFALAGLLVMVVTVPAYPDGLYTPRATRWLRLAVPLSLLFAPVAITVFGFAIVGLILACVLLLAVRYFRMPRGLQKQQLKWTVLGICGGLLLALVSAAMSEPTAAAGNPAAFNWWAAIGELLNQVAFGMIPAGVAVSLLEYRLNDADAAAGKSLGYAIVTVIVGVAWAIVQMLVGDYAKRWSGDPMMTTAITTVIAALVFTPARAYVLSWTEKKFQPALVRLRKLPEKLVRWQTCHTPDELAAATLADLVPGVGAAYAAVLGDDGREWRVLGASGIEPGDAAAKLALDRPAERDKDPFPIRIELADQLGQPDLLAIGPRSDGASFTRDEHAAIAMIVEPLSNAIQAAALRERHIVKVENSLAGIDQRLGRLEVELAPLAEKVASRRSPKGSSEAGRSSRT